MVVGVWELVLFLWSHPVISCMVLLLFSPPFFPVIVYFSPLLICTGLVAVAMVSMNVGGSAESEEDWRDGTRSLREPAAHAEMQLKPVKESWLEWMRKLEARAKAWVESWLLKQENWQFGKITSYKMLQRGLSTPLIEVTGGSISAPTKEEHESIAVNNDMDKGLRISSPRDLLISQLTRSDFHAMQESRYTLPQQAIVAETINNRSYSSVPEETQAVPDVQRPVEGRSFEASSKLQAVVEDEFLQGENFCLPLILEEEVLPVARYENASNEKCLRATKDESLGDEQALSDEESEPIPVDEIAVEVASALLHEEMLPPAGIYGSVFTCSEDEGLPEFLTMSAVVTDNDQVTRIEPLVSAHGTVSGDPRSRMSVEEDQSGLDDEGSKFQVSAHPYGSNRRAVEVVCPIELNASDDSSQSSSDVDMSVFAACDQLDVAGPDARLIETEKIVIDDEPSKITTINDGIIEGEIGRDETSPIQKASGQIVEVETALPLNRSSGEGLDENNEGCRMLPSTASAAAELPVSEPMALVSRSESAETLSSTLSSETDESIELAPSLNELELPTFEKIEPVRSPTTNEVSITTALSVLDRSHSLKFCNVGKEHDDLTERFFALKKSMSLYTRGDGEPISLQPAETSTNAVVVPALSPGMITRVERDPFAQSLVFPEKPKPRPQISSGAEESVEAITARLQKKFGPNSAKENTIIMPVKQETDKPITNTPTRAIAPASVESDENAKIVGENLTPPIDGATVKNGLAATPENSNSKKSLSSFLSRRRDKLMSPLMEAFSNSSDGDRGKKVSSDNLPLIKTQGAAAQDKDEGSTTTPGRLLKDKMMSPLKRVFSMDSSAGSGKKNYSDRVSAVKSSPVKEKQSGRDKSKDRIMKLFSFDGRGMSKLEIAEEEKLAGLGTVELRKSKSVSIHRGQKAEVGEQENVPVHEGNVSSPTRNAFPSLDGQEKERVDIETEKILPRIDSPSRKEGGEVELDGNLKPLQASSFEKKTLPTTIETGGTDELATTPRRRLQKSPQEKKFSLSWTKKKRTSEPLDPLTARLRLPDDEVSLSGKCNDEESREIVMSPLRHFNSSSTMNAVDESAEEADARSPLRENHSSETELFWASSKHQEPLKAVSPEKKSASSWWSPKADLSTERGESPEKLQEPLKAVSPEKISASYWWSLKADLTTERGESPEKLQEPLKAVSPEKKSAISWWSLKADLTTERGESPEKHQEPLKAVSPEKKSASSWWSPKADLTTESGESPEKRVSSSWWLRRHSIADSKAEPGLSTPPHTERSSSKTCIPCRPSSSREKDTVVSSSFCLDKRDNNHEDLFMDNTDGLPIANRAGRHQLLRGRSDSLPANSSRLGRLRERQTSFSEALLSRAPDLASSSLRVINYLDKGTPVSITRADDIVQDDLYYRPREKRNGDLIDSNSHNMVRRSNTSTLNSYQSRASVQTLDLALELRNSFNRCDLDVNNRHHRNSPSVAEIRITDKLKVPLDEVLSLLSTGERDDNHHDTTEANTSGAVLDNHRQAASSSSSSEVSSLNSSEEEWSSVSEDDDEPQKQHQFVPLPPVGRIRRKLPHYIFNRGEATAN